MKTFNQSIPRLPLPSSDVHSPKEETPAGNYICRSAGRVASDCWRHPWTSIVRRIGILKDSCSLHLVLAGWRRQSPTPRINAFGIEDVGLSVSLSGVFSRYNQGSMSNAPPYLPLWLLISGSGFQYFHYPRGQNSVTLLTNVGHLIKVTNYI